MARPIVVQRVQKLVRCICGITGSKDGCASEIATGTKMTAQWTNGVGQAESDLRHVYGRGRQTGGTLLNRWWLWYCGIITVRRLICVTSTATSFAIYCFSGFSGWVPQNSHVMARKFNLSQQVFNCLGTLTKISLDICSLSANSVKDMRACMPSTSFGNIQCVSKKGAPNS